MSDSTRTNEFDGETEKELSQVERAVRFLTAEGPGDATDTGENEVATPEQVAKRYGLDAEELVAYADRDVNAGFAFLLGWVAKTHQGDAAPDVEPFEGFTGDVSDDSIESILDQIAGGIPAL